jgi:hypothetical protein
MARSPLEKLISVFSAVAMSGLALALLGATMFATLSENYFVLSFVSTGLGLWLAVMAFFARRKAVRVLKTQAAERR